MNSKNTLKTHTEKNGFLKSLGLAIGTFIALIILIWVISSILNLHELNHSPVHDMIFFNAQIALALISSILLIFLLAQYLEGFLRYKTEFTAGFIILALVLLAHSITSNPIFFSYFGYEPMKGPFSIIPLIFTLIAALALLYLNRQ